MSSPNPHIRKKHIVLKGEVPSPLHVPKGCVFSSRCPYCRKECLEKRPELKNIPGSSSHRAACILPFLPAEDRS